MYEVLFNISYEIMNSVFCLFDKMTKVTQIQTTNILELVAMGRMHDAVESASLRLKLTYELRWASSLSRYAERRLSSSSSSAPGRSLVPFATRRKWFSQDVAMVRCQCTLLYT